MSLSDVIKGSLLHIADAVMSLSIGSRVQVSVKEVSIILPLFPIQRFIDPSYFLLYFPITFIKASEVLYLFPT